MSKKYFTHILVATSLIVVSCSGGSNLDQSMSTQMLPKSDSIEDSKSESESDSESTNEDSQADSNFSAGNKSQPRFGTGDEFDHLAYGKWLSTSLILPGRYYRASDQFDFSTGGIVFGDEGSPTPAPGAATFSGGVYGRNVIDDTVSSGNFKMKFDAHQGFTVSWSGAAAKYLLPIDNGSIDWSLFPSRNCCGGHTWKLSSTIDTEHGGQGLTGFIYNGDTVAGGISRIDTGLDWQGYWSGKK